MLEMTRNGFNRCVRAGTIRPIAEGPAGFALANLLTPTGPEQFIWTTEIIKVWETFDDWFANQPTPKKEEPA